MSKIEVIADLALEAMIADGLDEAIIGLTDVWDSDGSIRRIVAYDKQKVLEILINRDSMEEDEAEEFFQFNIGGAYVGKGTPIFIEKVQ